VVGVLQLVLSDGAPASPCSQSRLVHCCHSRHGRVTVEAARAVVKVGGGLLPCNQCTAGGRMAKRKPSLWTNPQRGGGREERKKKLSHRPEQPEDFERWAGP